MTPNTSTNCPEMDSSKLQSRKAPSTAASAPRKRRKRAVVSGAPDDCFTCAKKGTTCDRRRPYCSQCLDRGKACSGYKTTLTWGVGVASRGKLRGLSLPVTGAQPAGNSKSRRQAASKHSTTTIPTPTQRPSPGSDSSGNSTWAGLSHNGWSNTPMNYSPDPRPLNQGLYQPTFSENVATTPVLPHNQINFVGYPTATLPPKTWPVPTHTPIKHWPLQPHTSETQESDEDQAIPGNHSQSSSSRSPESSPLWATGHSPSYSQLLLARSVGRTPRLRYLISYYAEVVAPMVVAFDTPTSPFRTYILRLAEESESLQEAIATLSTSNLRQRRDRKMMSTERTLPARMSSLAHRALTEGGFQDGYGPSLPGGYAGEERFHRGMAVKALNAELADPQRRLSDSVLATLLILCLFHLCDTGVAQFKTQFAGVTKLLAMRMHGSKKVSDELKWFIRMFTWYDTMTATTNDRENQLRGPCLDAATISDGEWPLENLVGCDSGLFKLVAQLGRLNLLSQNEKAAGPAPPDMFAPIAPVPPSMLQPPFMSTGMSTFGAVDMYGFPVSNPPQPDQTRQPSSPAFWAEWYSLRQKLESWRFVPSSGRSSVSSSTPIVPHQAYISPPSSPSSSQLVAPQNLEDVFHTSESFRHAALLYSERLAYPDISSSHPRIQSIVHRAISHIMAVHSDVYLLWPLFIIGSECIIDNHRSLIRERCKDLSKDSGFFNNLSCLELLEKIWTSPDGKPSDLDNTYNLAAGQMPQVNSWQNEPATANMTQTCIPRGNGFRWHQIMQAKRGDGEYMVV